MSKIVLCDMGLIKYFFTTTTVNKFFEGLVEFRRRKMYLMSSNLSFIQSRVLTRRHELCEVWHERSVNRSSDVEWNVGAVRIQIARCQEVGHELGVGAQQRTVDDVVNLLVRHVQVNLKKQTNKNSF